MKLWETYFRLWDRLSDVLTEEKNNRRLRRSRSVRRNVETVTMAISAMKGRVSRVASEWEKLNSGLYQAESIGSAFVLFPGAFRAPF